MPPRSPRVSTPLPRRDRPATATSPHTVTPVAESHPIGIRAQVDTDYAQGAAAAGSCHEVAAEQRPMDDAERRQLRCGGAAQPDHFGTSRRVEGGEGTDRLAEDLPLAAARLECDALQSCCDGVVPDLDARQVVAGRQGECVRAPNGLARPTGRSRAQAAAWRDLVPGGPGPQLLSPNPGIPYAAL